MTVKQDLLVTPDTPESRLSLFVLRELHILPYFARTLSNVLLSTELNELNPMRLLQFFSSSGVDRSVNFARHALESRQADQAYECVVAWRSWQLGSLFISVEILKPGAVYLKILKCHLDDLA